MIRVEATDISEINSYLRGDIVGPLGEAAAQLLDLAADTEEWQSPTGYMKLIPEVAPPLNSVVAAALRHLADRGSN